MDLEPHLPDILAGTAQSANAQELCEYAMLCRFKEQYRHAVRLYLSAFAREKHIVSTWSLRHPSDAARAAVLLAANDQDLDAAERAGWRKQALDWLQTYLAILSQQHARTPQHAHVIQLLLWNWQHHDDLASVRETKELAGSPSPNRRPGASSGPTLRTS